MLADVIVEKEWRGNTSNLPSTGTRFRSSYTSRRLSLIVRAVVFGVPPDDSQREIRWRRLIRMRRSSMDLYKNFGRRSVTIESMFRFKLRTLLIATALVGLCLGLQVHVHNKAKRFLEEMREPTQETKERLGISLHSSDFSSHLAPISFNDVIRFERRCEVVYFRPTTPIGDSRVAFEASYLVQCVGEVCNGTQGASVVGNPW